MRLDQAIGLTDGRPAARWCAVGMRAETLDELG
jgi:hypothetical protein